jgi:hypothetical protein
MRSTPCSIARCSFGNVLSFRIVNNSCWGHCHGLCHLAVQRRFRNCAVAFARQHLENPCYGGILMIWDHLFGTYEREDEKVVFGLTQPINSVNPWKVHFEEFARLIQKFRMLKTGRAKIRLLFMGPDVAITD